VRQVSVFQGVVPLGYEQRLGQKVIFGKTPPFSVIDLRALEKLNKSGKNS